MEIINYFTRKQEYIILHSLTNIKIYELKLLEISKLSNSKNIYYDMLHLLSKIFFPNRPNCGKMKQDISETISQANP